MIKIFKLAVIAILSAYLAACTSAAQTANMIYQGPKKGYPEPLNNNVIIDSVSGGEETNPMWTSEISSQAFSEALLRTMTDQGLIGEGRRFSLAVNIIEVDQPWGGVDLEVVTKVRYILTEMTTEQVIFDESITAPYTAEFSDAILAGQRLQFANEGSARKNIELFLEVLAASNLPKSDSTAAN